MAGQRKAPAKPRLMYATKDERHYDNGLAEYLEGGKWVKDESNVFGPADAPAVPDDTQE